MDWVGVCKMHAKPPAAQNTDTRAPPRQRARTNTKLTFFPHRSTTRHKTQTMKRATTIRPGDPQMALRQHPSSEPPRSHDARAVHATTVANPRPSETHAAVAWPIRRCRHPNGKKAVAADPIHKTQQPAWINRPHVNNQRGAAKQQEIIPSTHADCGAVRAA